MRGTREIDAFADDFRFAEAEHALAGGGRIERADDAFFVDGQHHVLDVIEDDLQMLGALRAHFVRHGRASSAMRRIDCTMPRRSSSTA